MKRFWLFFFLFLLTAINFLFCGIVYFRNQKINREFAEELITASKNIIERSVQISKTTSKPDIKDDQPSNVEEVPLNDDVELKRLNYYYFVDAGRRKINCGRDEFCEGDYLPTVGKIDRIYDQWLICNDGKIIVENGDEKLGGEDDGSANTTLS